MTRIAGCHVIVTGGSQGIGLATARACASRGARVSVMARDPDRLARVQGTLPSHTSIAAADVTDAPALGRAVAELVARNGPCDILVTAAGGAEPGYFLDQDVEACRRQMELNYFGTLHAVRSVLPGMLDRGRGHIVLVASLAGLVGAFGYGSYTPTKYAVRGLGEALHAEFRHRGIVTSIVYPPDTDTPGLERENRTKPAETKRLSAGDAPLSSARVAAAIARGIEHDRLQVGVDLPTRVIARLADLHGPALRAMLRRRARLRPEQGRRAS